MDKQMNLKKQLESKSDDEIQEIRCNVCQTVIEKKLKIPGINKVATIYKSPVCMCDKENYEAHIKSCEDYEKNKQQENKRREMEEKQLKLDKLKKYSMMDEQFKNSNFDNWDINKSPVNIKNIGLKYVENWEEMKKNNTGLLIHGNPGGGKSYLSFSIANALIQQYIPIIAISTIGILNKIKDTYRNFGKEGEVEIINSINNASLLVLDDIGAEASTEWTNEKLYEIIDYRYRSKKPTITTTNLTPEQLREKLKGNDGVARTYDRLIEMCIPIKINGESKRRIIAEEKEAMIKKLFWG